MERITNRRPLKQEGQYEKRRNLMHKKRTFAGCVLILAMLAASLSGCSGRQEEETASLKIGVLLYDQYNSFLEEYMKAFNDYAREQSKVLGMTITIDTVGAAGSQSTQNSQVEDMLQEDYDLLCVNLVDRTDASRIISLSESDENHRPIIFFNRELVKNDLETCSNFYYVGAVVEEAGRKQGSMAATYYKEHPEMDRNKDGVIQYLVLEGEVGNQDAVARTKYSITMMQEIYGTNLEKVGNAIANWSRDQAKAKVYQLLTQNPEIELILANNDTMALGAVDAIQELGLKTKNRPAVFGIDGITEGTKAVAAGSLQGTIYNNLEEQTSNMLNLALALHNQDTEALSQLLKDDGHYVRSHYSYLTACKTCETGYVIWDREEDLETHKKADQEAEKTKISAEAEQSVK